MTARQPIEPFRLPGPVDGWTRAHEVALEGLALETDTRPDLAAAALAALGEIHRLRPLADAGLQAARAWTDLDPGERGNLIEHTDYTAFDRLAEAHGLGGDADERPAGGTPVGRQIARNVRVLELLEQSRRSHQQGDKTSSRAAVTEAMDLDLDAFLAIEGAMRFGAIPQPGEDGWVDYLDAQRAHLATDAAGGDR